MTFPLEISFTLYLALSKSVDVIIRQYVDPDKHKVQHSLCFGGTLVYNLKQAIDPELINLRRFKWLSDTSLSRVQVKVIDI